ncbi:integrase arm-type DNA-binding domain-containing protein [Sphingobium sp. SA2]|uniref:tyrosine-type recombinase/integrase n=1 Tax=Sphingobium sp. SA2 TaxID=1524832 RepID=UPI0028C1CC85|nr:integrase arm-type DNA-binding domain-containing protein [Sphingobium sp. SA2]MDT7535369.1 integrase arm-type DNA-binding domain-containing protein [Sphingobium sp. SA2]
MAKAAITKRAVDAAKPAGTDQFIWDDGREATPGFGLKITPAGSKVYVFQYRLARPGEAARTPAKRYTIGKHGQLTPDQARRRARELAAMVATGIDPLQAEKAAHQENDRLMREAADRIRLDGELAFSRYAAIWLDHYENEKERRPSSVRLARSIVNNHLKPALADKPMPHIGRADLQPILDAIPVGRKGIRRAVFAYASVLFGWAAKRGDIASNPLGDMAKPEAPKARDRVLADDEVARIWRAAFKLSDPFGPFFRLLILTGQRRNEVTGLNWVELDRALATWVIPAARAKNHVAHIVPLSPMALAELDRLARLGERDADGNEIVSWPKAGFALTTTGRTPISGITKAKRALDEAVAKADVGQDEKHIASIAPARARSAPETTRDALAAWRIHDLRRTVATGFQRLGIRFEVTEAILNHVSGAKGGIAGIYQRHDWKEEKRAALEAWARHVAGIITPAGKDNVVSLDAAKRSA